MNPAPETTHVQRVRKLLALAAQEDSPEEAAAAWAKAQELIDRYAIDRELLRGDDCAEGAPAADVRVVHEPLWRGKLGASVPTWRLTLSNAVTTANRCQGIHRRGEGLDAVGHPDDVATCGLLFDALAGETERLLKLARARGEHYRGTGRGWNNAFRNGCVATITRRLHDAAADAVTAARDAAAPTAAAYAAATAAGDVDAVLALDAQAATAPYALARVDAALTRLAARVDAVAAHVAGLKLRRGRARSAGSDFQGYAAGARAGQAANLSAPRGRLA